MTLPRKANFKRRFIEKYGQAEWVKRYGKQYFYPEGYSLKSVVRALRKLNKEGFKNYFAIYNGHYLYSFNVTYDFAIKQIYGISRSTYYRILKEAKAKLESLQPNENFGLKLKK